jgi:hypothetical protein
MRGLSLLLLNLIVLPCWAAPAAPVAPGSMPVLPPAPIMPNIGPEMQVQRFGLRPAPSPDPLQAYRGHGDRATLVARCGLPSAVEPFGADPLHATAWVYSSPAGARRGGAGYTMEIRDAQGAKIPQCEASFVVRFQGDTLISGEAGCPGGTPQGAFELMGARADCAQRVFLRQPPWVEPSPQPHSSAPALPNPTISVLSPGATRTHHRPAGEF